MAVLLQTDPVPGEYFAGALRRLAPGEAVWTSLESARLGEVEALLTWRLEPSLLPRLPALKLVSSMGAGVDQILSAETLSPDVAISRIVDPLQALSMTQYVLMMALRHVRGLPLLEENHARAQWSRVPPPQPYQYTVAILGLGAIGSIVATGLVDAGFNVVGWSRRSKQIPRVTSYVGSDGLFECVARADIIVGLLPSTADTVGLMNASLLGKARPGAYVINAGRGNQLVEEDFMVLVRSGHLSGGALDVTSIEPLPPDHALWRLPGVLITPHCAAEPSVEAIAGQVLENLARVRRGEDPLNVVDRSLGY